MQTHYNSRVITYWSFGYSWMHRCADVDLHVIRSKSGNWRERYFDGDFCMGHDGPDSITDNR